jgi:lipoprotein-anchoring transpeptidase ErfK/SrfK
LTAVQVTSASATAGASAVSGALDPAGQTWQSAGALAPHTEYTVSVHAVSPSGQPVEQVSHFGTVTPKAVLGVSIFPGDGLTVGVGMPIELHFDRAVQNKDAILNRLQVTESTPVVGGWHWFSDKELHFRPQQYWPTGEQISLTANLAGFDAGNGIWAVQNHAVHFAIGDAHIATANVATEQLSVTTNGQVVATYPLSAGRTKYPTMGGVHIALYRQYDVHMISSSVGIPVNSPDGYDEHVFWDVNISDGGEFVHAAPWSVGAQGRSNVSHGCINLSVANATAFFNFSRVGDVVQVVGSPRPPSLGDHGTMDWTTPSDQWVQPISQSPPAGVA